MKEPSFQFTGWAAVLVIAGGVFLIWYWMRNHKPQQIASESVQVIEVSEQKALPSGTKNLKYSLTTAVKHLKVYPPWISFSLINDGDGDVYVSTTDEHDLLDQVGVKKNETINCDMEAAVIKEIWLSSDSTASIRIYAKVGQG